MDPKLKTPLRFNKQGVRDLDFGWKKPPVLVPQPQSEGEAAASVESEPPPPAAASAAPDVPPPDQASGG